MTAATTMKTAVPTTMAVPVTADSHAISFRGAFAVAQPVQASAEKANCSHEWYRACHHQCHLGRADGRGGAKHHTECRNPRRFDQEVKENSELAFEAASVLLSIQPSQKEAAVINFLAKGFV